MKHIGILALQGNFHQHADMLVDLRPRIRISFIRSQSDLINHTFDGIILPGGESTTMLHLLQVQDMNDLLISTITQGTPVLATCAGAILLAKYKFHQKKYQSFAIAKLEIERNAYGRQYDSFVAKMKFNPPHSNSISSPYRNSIQGLFIRAPKIITLAPQIHIISSHNNDPIIVQDRHLLISTCHPESVPDTLLHEYFIDMMIQKQN